MKLYISRATLDALWERRPVDLTRAEFDRWVEMNVEIIELIPNEE